MQINYNILALQGQGTDDMEYVDNFNLDPSVAYTKQINEVMIQQTYQDNIDFGTDPKEASVLRKRAMARVNDLYKKNGL